MLVGLGGNNGSTFVAGILANKRNIEFETKQGTQKSNFYGSFTQSATTHIGFKYNEEEGDLQDVFKPINELLPMAHPCDFEVSGWDISNKNLYEACKRARVLEPDLIKKLKSDLEQIKPLPAALNGDFIAANQSDRADNCFTGTNKEIVEKLRGDIREMKGRTDKVVVLWTANTEQFLLPEIKDINELKEMIERNTQIPASVLYCVAAIEEQCLYLNGSPQNTFHPGVIEYAAQKKALLAGSDFKSG
mmetsp:Transcript_19121/g.18252  ORF Transcript_19121/g.18252 Transcript_19121/m.18252 type:complete len:247 (+) Transcript_19121:247-987(+)|eukprot:CAMPEP_0170545140 /NCGR_PEP_ID=MMETSP0211-20121228/3636_1 /TAXON_ID=311385 /ORGANISM="Pseudokeronopsis sp., Strain OXSARD2" /LENGTH=246 /DNA_ID=CAMNT_0010848963 /DNA_START=225 /DNA_END=965 /DNA_ORIENTATION=-